MSRKCIRCGCDIEASYILQNESYEEIRCPNCGRILIASNDSKKIACFIGVIVFLAITLFPIKLINIIFIEGIWIVISHFILPVLCFRYEEKNQDNNKDMG